MTILSEREVLTRSIRACGIAIRVGYKGEHICRQCISDYLTSKGVYEDLNELAEENLRLLVWPEDSGIKS